MKHSSHCELYRSFWKIKFCQLKKNSVFNCVVALFGTGKHFKCPNMHAKRGRANIFRIYRSTQRTLCSVILLLTFAFSIRFIFIQLTWRRFTFVGKLPKNTNDRSLTQRVHCQFFSPFQNSNQQISPKKNISTSASIACISLRNSWLVLDLVSGHIGWGHICN